MESYIAGDETETATPWFTDPAKGNIPLQLSDVINELILPAGLKMTDPEREAESAEYGACQFELQGKRVMFRVANTTPTKLGQFVTLWKRPHVRDEIAPIDFHDDIEFALVSVFDRQHRGLFVFNKHTLAQKGVMSVNAKGGKRAIRVYAPWVKPVVKQAIQTQRWQLQSFVPVEMNEANGGKLRRLLKMDSLF
ncbi:MepB protein [Serratia entomophila]|nr:MepB protein [Serratia entomophila]CAI1880028.1 MepB protein [Serratia entomophila]CAI1893285.1 MepB protein [Serratia entomophila]CAI1954663.1 MepB protein [Serratia entomophila]CAI1966331.1 MepB protein [Serratia entomophila]